MQFTKLLVGVLALPLGAAHSNAESANPCFAENTSDAPSSITQACSRYIDGFLDGALETDAAIIYKVDNEKMDGHKEESGSAEQSEFISRAFKTRLGTGLRDLPPTYLADFCLPSSITRAELIHEIAQPLSREHNPNPALGAVVYAILKDRFPCS